MPDKHTQIEPQNISPIDDMESFLMTTNWRFERVSSHEIVVNLKGQYCEYHITIAWLEQNDILHIAFSFSIGLSSETLPMKQEYSLMKLLCLMNESMQVGHFDLWREENSIVWRHAHALSDNYPLIPTTISKIFRLALESCERHYPAFQFVLWAGHSPIDALRCVLFETVGEA
jgi:hypothetical protein